MTHSPSPKPTSRPRVTLEVHRDHQYDEAACLRALRLVLDWPARGEREQGKEHKPEAA